MPRELQEIKKFVTGTITSASERDIPIDAASFSINVDSFSETGTLRGISTDSTILRSYVLSEIQQLDFNASEEDNDLVISGGAWETPLINEGATATISVRLTSQPTANVVITPASSLASGIGGIGISGVLTFTTSNWATNQNVTLTAVDSDYARDNIASTVSFTIASDDAEWVATAALDHWTEDIENHATNTAGFVHFIPAYTSIGEATSNTATYTFKLGSKPTGDNNVIILLQESATHFNLNTTSLTFTSSNWNTTQNIVVTAVNNSDTTTNPTETFKLIAQSSSSEYDGLELERYVIVVNDDSTDEPPTCFAENTLVNTPSSQIPIQDINIGDSILSYNLNNKSVEVNYVKYLSEHNFNENKEDLYEIEFIDIEQKLIGTSEHEIATIKGSYKPLKSLKVGDYAITDNSKTRIKSIKINKKYNGKLYNLEMDNTPHNYFANDILVHNGVWDGTGGGGKNPRKPEPPTYTTTSSSTN